MPQVITPPAIGEQEVAGKNWYRAEALRKVTHDLINVYADVDDGPARRELKNAIDSIDEARFILNPALRPVKKSRR